MSLKRKINEEGPSSRVTADKLFKLEPLDNQPVVGEVDNNTQIVIPEEELGKLKTSEAAESDHYHTLREVSSILEDVLNEMKGQIAGLQSELAGLKTENSKLKTEISELKTENSKIDKPLTSLQKKMDVFLDNKNDLLKPLERSLNLFNQPVIGEVDNNTQIVISREELGNLKTSEAAESDHYHTLREVMIKEICVSIIEKSTSWAHIPV